MCCRSSLCLIVRFCADELLGIGALVSVSVILQKYIRRQKIMGQGEQKKQFLDVLKIC